MTKKIKKRKESSLSLHKALERQKPFILTTESSVLHKRTENKPKIMPPPDPKVFPS
jgi:hypothetical protein